MFMRDGYLHYMKFADIAAASAWNWHEKLTLNCMYKINTRFA